MKIKIFLPMQAVWLFIVIVMIDTPSVLAGETLSRVRLHKELKCGVPEHLVGFSYKDGNGRWQGFNVDFCRAVATATLGDPEKVSFTPLNVSNRFPALLSGEIDLLVHTATWTFEREAGIGIDFPGIYFYDGQTFAVPDNKGIKRIEDLKGLTICVKNGTTFQSNMQNTFAKRGIKYTPLVVDSENELIEAINAGRCQVCTAERSVLAAMLAKLPNYSKHYKILPDKISKEPFALAVQSGDHEWSTLIRWVLFALIQAEEYGVTSANVHTLQKETTDPELRWFLNSCGGHGNKLGLKPDWVADVIAAVGNYGEIFKRNFGSNSLNIERGMNRLWEQGGLLYAPSFQ